MKFIMTVYKPSGKYYTSEEIDVPDLPFHEIKKTEEYKVWENMYPSMFKSCVIDKRTAEYEDFSYDYCTPFLILPKDLHFQ